MHHATVFASLECVAVDVMVPLPITDNGNQYVIVFSNYSSKWTESYALLDFHAQTFPDKFVVRLSFLLPPHVSIRIRDLNSNPSSSPACAGLRKSRKIEDHPLSDGMVECFNDTLDKCLPCLSTKTRMTEMTTFHITMA